MRHSRFVLACCARLVRSTVMVDRCYRLFDRLRSKYVLACAPDAFYDVYNDLTYSRQAIYRADAETFRASLFAFEERVIARHFPPPPGTVLIGAAGGGREALALARRGYEVVAFDPAARLAASIVRASGEFPIETFVGRYEDLPVLSSLARPPVVTDLRSRAPFAAAIMGWVSFSHLRSDARCIDALRQIGNLTRGPILVSSHPGDNLIGFSAHMGYYRGLSSADIGLLGERAGLETVFLDDGDNWPYAVLRATPTCAKTMTTQI
jgi:SAM-dependent methyltransferase